MLVNTHWFCVPGLDKLPRFLVELFKTTKGPVLIKRVAGFEVMKGHKRILALSPDSILMFIDARSDLAAC